MADYSFKIDLNSSDYYSGIQAAKNVTTEMTASMREFDSVLKSSQGDLNAAAQSLTQMMAQQRAAAAAAKDMAAAKIAEAKASSDAQRAEDAHNESMARQELAAQRSGQAQEQAHLATTRAANEYMKTESQLSTQLQQRQIAQQNATNAQEKHNATMERSKQNELELQDNLSNTRYLLYDYTATLGAASAALSGFSGAATAVAADYQKDFAQVLRITDQSTQSAASLRDGLVNLTTNIPVNFDEATGIAQMGAHLQLGNEGLVAFTDTVAKFTAATGASADTAALLFSRMQTSMSDAADSGNQYFNKLGSSLAQVGTVSKVSDAAVTSMATSISAATASAGIGTAATVGLASALASLAVQPEMARGALTRLFANFNRDSVDATGKMDAFGKVMGLTGQQAADLWKSDPSQFFTQLISGLHDAYANGQNLTVLFDQMGVKNVRDIGTLQRLAIGYDQLTSSMAAANQGFTDGTALNELSKPVFETLAAKLQELGSAIKGFLDSIGSAGLAPLVTFIDGLKGIVTAFTDLNRAAPVIPVIISGFLGLAAVTAVLLGIKAGMAGIISSLVTFQQVLGSNAASAISFKGVLQQIAATMLVGKGATDELANSLVKGTSGFKALGMAAAASAADVKALNASVLEEKVSMEEASLASGGFSGGLKGVMGMVSGLVGGLPGLIALLAVGLVGGLIAAKGAADEAGKAISDAFGESQQAGMKAIADAMNNKKMDFFSDGNMSDWGKSMTEVADRLGVSLDKAFAAVAKGKNGVADLNAEFDRVAQSKGFKDLNDWASQPGLAPGDAASLEALKNYLEGVANANGQTTEDTKKTSDALKTLGIDAGDTSGELDTTTTAADTLDKTLKGLNDTIFSAVNAQAALGDASDKLGQSLQKSHSFGNDAGGRTNVKNYQDVLAKAQESYAEMVQLGQMTGDQAQAAYQQFLNDLNAKVTAMGGNLGNIQDLAQKTVSEFGNAVRQYGSSNPATVSVKADPQSAQASTDVAAAAIHNALNNSAAAGKFLANIGVNADPAKGTMAQMAKDIATITGVPYDIILDALTNPASTHAEEVQQLIVDIVNGKYKATITADTQPAMNNVTTFYNDAMHKLSAVQSFVNNLAATAPTLAKYGGFGATPNFSTTPYAPVSAPTVSSDGGASQDSGSGVADAMNLAGTAADNMAAGMDTAADKTDKAGKAAGNTAKQVKDLSSGLSEAAQNADDYASRLKTGLDHAFEMQYGVQTATDAYYTQLNAINKARDDENKKVSDLIDKIKQLKDEQSKDLVDANKAKIEQQISVKYGEVDRAADYGNQAQTHLDDAASKQKEIDANQKDLQTTQDGIGKLDGYTDAAIKNRAALRDLEQKHLDMVVAYAKTGASVDQVRAYTQNLDAQFRNDVQQLGFNGTAVLGLVGNLQRYIDIINAVPYLKPTTVTANTQPATDALNGLNDLLNTTTAPRDAKIWVTGTVFDTGRQTSDHQEIYGVTDPNTQRFNGTYLFNQGGEVPGFADGGMIPGNPPSDPRQDNMMAAVDGRGMIKVRSREFIQPQEAVDYYGQSFMEDIRRMRLPKYGSFSGGSAPAASSAQAPSGFGVVSLSADSLAQIARLADREIYLFTTDEVIARSAQRGSTVLASKGVS